MRIDSTDALDQRRERMHGALTDGAERVVREQSLASTLPCSARCAMSLVLRSRLVTIRSGPGTMTPPRCCPDRIDAIDRHRRADADDAGEPRLQRMRGDHRQPAIDAELRRFRIGVANAARLGGRVDEFRFDLPSLRDASSRTSSPILAPPTLLTSTRSGRPTLLEDHVRQLLRCHPACDRG